jgi:hypothetical protein
MFHFLIYSWFKYLLNFIELSAQIKTIKLSVHTSI